MSNAKIQKCNFHEEIFELFVLKKEFYLCLIFLM